MPKRSNKSTGSKGVLTVMILALMGAGVFAAYVKYAPNAAHVPTDLRRNEPEISIDAKPNRSELVQTPAATTDNLLVPSVVNNEVKLVNPAGQAPEGTKPEVFLVNQTLASLMIDKARAIGVDVKGRVAMMDFNPQIQKGYGTFEEGNLIKALQMALGQFKNIDKFQIIVEGKPIESLGNIDLTTPIDVIRPGQTQATTTSEETKPPATN